MERYLKKLTLGIILLLISLPTSALAATYYVPDDFATIQEALNATLDLSGDTVIVRDGTYTGTGNKNLNFYGRRFVTLRSENGPANCVIDCQNDGRGFIFEDDEGGSEVRGFTIANGSVPAGDGGAIYCSASSPFINDCIITGNSAVNGGGIACSNQASPYIVNCAINNNAASTRGGGIYSFGEFTEPSLRNCSLEANSAVSGGGGGCSYSSAGISFYNCRISSNTATLGAGIYAFNYSFADAVACSINDNTATYGGGIAADYFSSASATNCAIFNNSTGSGGGGIYFYTASQGYVINCQVIGNSANSFGARGGGIYCVQSNPTIANCTIADNSVPSSGYGGGICLSNSSLSEPVSNCILWNNQAANGPELALRSSSTVTMSYSDVEGGSAAAYVSSSTLNWGAGNIDSDPLFARANDYHIASGSPCIDTGTSEGLWLPADDIDGDARPRATGLDMGSDEYYEVNLTLVPDVNVLPNSTVIPRGGTLGYTVTVTNRTASKLTFKYWTTVNLPNGATYPPSGPLFGPAAVTLNPFASRSVHLTQGIPTPAPLGAYTYNGYIGVYPTAMNERHFEFSVVAP